MFAIANMGDKYVDRGDPADNDFTVGDFTIDGDWHDLDLTGIVPKGNLPVHFVLFGHENAGNKWIWIRKKGQTNNRNVCILHTQQANIYGELFDFVVCDSDCKIEYKIDASTWGALVFTVRGWLV